MHQHHRQPIHTVYGGAHLFRADTAARLGATALKALHEYAPGNPFHLEDYPEPKFDDVSRSRVLHIFKDRGEEEAEIESPYDFSWEPSPLTVA